MKSLIVIGLLMAAIVFAGGSCSAQTPGTPVTGVQFGPFTVGEDNMILWEKGVSSKVAVGVGTDIATLSEPLSSTSTLNIILHGSVMTAVSNTNGNNSPIYAGALYVPIMPLLGSKLTILIPNLSVDVGPGGAYDSATGKFGYGVMGLVKYTF